MNGSSVRSPVTDSTISGNSATTTTDFYGRRGHSTSALRATLSISRSTISGNTSNHYGGGILFYSGSGTVDITQSTLFRQCGRRW